MLGIRWTVRGLENVDNSRGAVVLLNHQTGLDLYGTLCTFTSGVKKQEKGFVVNALYNIVENPFCITILTGDDTLIRQKYHELLKHIVVFW